MRKIRILTFLVNKTEKTSSLQARAITDHDQNDPKNDHVDQNCLNDQDDQYQH